MPISLPLSFEGLLRGVEVVAICAMALSGLMEAARKDMDVVGVFASAFITAFGGGTVRDILLDRRPLFWVQYHEYVVLTFVLCLVAIPLLRRRHFPITEKAIRIPDALGLGLFTAAGVGPALEAALPLFIAALMGVVTGVFGGVLRDVICNEIPIVFRDRRPYALCSFAGAWVFIAMYHAGASPFATVATVVVVTAGLRLLALARGWTVPGLPGTADPD